MASAIPFNLPHRPAHPGLSAKLSAVLPKPHVFHVYHISTPPTKTEALCSAPPGEREDKTYVEKHFLAIAIDVPSQSEACSSSSTISSCLTASAAVQNGCPTPTSQVLVMALEMFIFTSAFSSIFFVSKADSTGYLHHLNLPRGTPSPIREVASTFLTHLLHTRRRSHVPNVVSLFARSQAQYLFPGSIENSGKHVLDDRGLVRWWCRVLNPLLEEPQLTPARWNSVKGHLVVPGLDSYEMRAFLPRTEGARENWILEHPLYRISHYAKEYDRVPPRCLIPKFPDDPKSRFRDELDDETHNSTGTQTTGAWKSVRNLEQFWDMMAFRQECSSGQLTGFIWLVFDPLPTSNTGPDIADPFTSTPTSVTTTATTIKIEATTTTIATIKPPITCLEPPSTPPRTNLAPPLGAIPQQVPSPLKSIAGTPVKAPPPPSSKKKKVKLTGRIVPRQPHVKTQRRKYLPRIPVTSPHYYWPEEGRGIKLVDKTGYKNISDLLLRLDFANLDIAISCTRRWVQEVGLGENWSIDVVGERELPAESATEVPMRRASEQQGEGADEAAGKATKVNNLNGLVKRKRSVSDANAAGGGRVMTVLGAELVRKKHKGPQSIPEGEPAGDVVVVNVLGS